MAVDPDKLAGLLRAAAQHPPEARFDEQDIVRESHRLDRKKNRLIASVLAAVVLIGGGIVAGSQALRHTGGQSTAEQPAVAHRGTASPGQATPFAHLPAGPPVQGGGSAGKSGPRAGDTHSGCRQEDGELAAALAAELPAPVSPAPVTAISCARPVRVAAATSDGRIYYAVLAGGVHPGFDPPWSGLAARARIASSPSAAGPLTLVTVAAPTGAPPTGAAPNVVAPSGPRQQRGPT
ncbi:MAG: hypothetical protein ACRDQ1_21225, partial [Sciscionella sp.]